jgi:hypothetical protein
MQKKRGVYVSLVAQVVLNGSNDLRERIDVNSKKCAPAASASTRTAAAVTKAAAIGFNARRPEQKYGQQLSRALTAITAFVQLSCVHHQRMSGNSVSLRGHVAGVPLHRDRKWSQTYLHAIRLEERTKAECQLSW